MNIIRQSGPLSSNLACNVPLPNEGTALLQDGRHASAHLNTLLVTRTKVLAYYCTVSSFSCNKGVSDPYAS
jgi:hypothetical protein